jgi:hypothetical protein
MLMQQRASFAMLALSVCLVAYQVVPEHEQSEAGATALFKDPAPVQAAGVAESGQRMQHVALSVLPEFALRSRTRLVPPVLAPVRAMRFFSGSDCVLVRAPIPRPTHGQWGAL